MRPSPSSLQAPSAQIRFQSLLGEQLVLRGQHLQVIADAFAVAKHRQLVGFAGRVNRLLFLDALGCDAAQRAQAVGDIAQRIGQRLVVLFDRYIVGGIGTGQLRATASGVKQWQVKGGADARLTFTGADQRAWT